MRQHGEHGVIICFIQPPATTQLNKRAEETTERKRAHSQVDTKILENSKARANEKSLAKDEVPIPDPCSDLQRNVFREQRQQPGQQVHVGLLRCEGADFKQITRSQDIVIQPMGWPCNNKGTMLDLHVQVDKVLMQRWYVQFEEVLKCTEVAEEEGVR